MCKRNGNAKKSSKFICLKCLDWKTTYIPGVQRINQREPDHVKNSACLKCGDVQTMEVRYCDYLPYIMQDAILKHNEMYHDNITEVYDEFYGTISV